MPPSDSKIIGNATIWDRDDEVGDGGEFEWFNSQPYPYIYNDSIDVELSVNSIRMRSILETQDSIDVDFFIASIDLMSEVLYSTYNNWPPEYLDLELKVVNITLTTEVFYSTYEMQEEYVDVEAFVNSIVLTTEVGNINYEEWPPESVDLEMFINSITLSS